MNKYNLSPSQKQEWNKLTETEKRIFIERDGERMASRLSFSWLQLLKMTFDIIQSEFARIFTSAGGNKINVRYPLTDTSLTSLQKHQARTEDMKDLSWFGCELQDLEKANGIPYCHEKYDDFCSVLEDLRNTAEVTRSAIEGNDVELSELNISDETLRIFLNLKKKQFAGLPVIEWRPCCKNSTYSQCKFCSINVCEECSNKPCLIDQINTHIPSTGKILESFGSIGYLEQKLKNK